MRKPLIGITPSHSRDTLAHGTFDRYVLNADYADAVIAAGGIPVILPYQAEVALLLDHLDGLLCSGGADLDPSLFGASSVHPATYGISPARDTFELDLVRRAVARDIAVLGICRGIQALNVAFGGSLVQDIATEYRTERPIVHRQQELGIAASEPGHVVHLAPGNPLHDRLGSTDLAVNSFHHQAIDHLASELSAIAWAEDGLIEAVVMPDRRFVLGVQWHPELMFPTHQSQLTPFQALVEAAQACMLQSETLRV